MLGVNYYPVVVQAIPTKDKCIAVYFSDGHIKEFDMKPLIEKSGVFERLKDDDFFTKRLTVLNGTAAWDLSGKHDTSDCIDLDPFVLYSEAKEIKDPLDESA